MAESNPTAHEWLVLGDFEHLDPDLEARFIQLVGYDKAQECRAAMQRITENLLDALGDLRLSPASMRKLLRAVSSIAVDNYFPRERRGG